MSGIGNKRPENQREYRKTYNKGINNDLPYELQGVVNKEKYIRSYNARVNGNKNSFGISRIHGEEQMNDFQFEGYFTKDWICVGADNVNGKKIAFWANIRWTESNPTHGIITIDDIVGVMSTKLPLRHDKYLDIDKDENTLGGEIYVTDNNLPPMYFNIKDILDNYWDNSLKYFDDFDYTNYTVNLSLPLNQMVYKEIVSVGGGNGRPVGAYSYSYRLVSSEGDNTNWSIPTQLIPVPAYLVTVEPSEENFKFQGTKGGPADPESYTSYAPKLILRIDNTADYNYVEIKRTEYNSGQGLGYLPQSYIVQRIPIFSRQFSILEIVDSRSNETDRIPVAPDDDISSLSVIKKAEAIAYFKNKVWLGNIEYEDRALQSDEVEFIEDIGGSKAHPSLRYIGEQGFKSPDNFVKYKSLLNGEKYGWAIVCYDESLQRTLALPIADYENYQMPDKRKLASTESFDLSKAMNRLYDSNKSAAYWLFFESLINHMPTLTTQDNNTEDYTYEVVLHTRLTEDAGGIFPFRYNGRTEPTSGLIANISKTSTVIDSTGAATGDELLPDQAGFVPRRPTGDNDNISTRRFGANTRVYDGSSWIDYYPDGLSPHYYSLGMSFYGLSKLPSWCKAFSIVRTKPAGRVLAQGLGVYHLTELGPVENTDGDWDDPWNPGQPLVIGDSLGGNNLPTDPARTSPSERIYMLGDYSLRQPKKHLRKLSVHIPDMQSAYISQSVIDDMMRNPSGYSIQLVEPLGFFSECFHGKTTSVLLSEDINAADYNVSSLMMYDAVDMITYARCQNEALMPDSLVGVTDPSGHVRYGLNRNSGVPFFIGGAISPSGLIFGVSSVSINTDNKEGVWYLDIELDTDIYGKPEVNVAAPNEWTAINARHYNDPVVSDWHEPIYIVNIIRTGAEIAQSSTKEYLAPSNFIKLESRVGIINANETVATLSIVDERMEDFHVSDWDASQGNRKFIYARKSNLGEDLVFININHLSLIDIGIIDSDIENGTTIFCGKVLYGKYTSTRDTITIDDATAYTPLTAGNKLSTGDEIYVKYDNNYPINVFGGEIAHGDAQFVFKHRETQKEGIIRGGVGTDADNVKYTTLNNFSGQFMLGIGFPFMSWELSEYVYKHGCEMSSAVKRQRFNLNFIRQWLFLYTCQSRTALPYTHGAFFPNVNYIERPRTWFDEESVTLEDQRIFPEYETIYPGERKRWTLGGFAINQYIQPFNFDYSKDQETERVYSRPAFLLDAETKFPTRVAWSNTRPIQSYASPNLRTFRPFNYKDISDKFGAIRKLFISSDRAGDNLYAFLDNDIALLLINKRTLTEASGQMLATASTDDVDAIKQDVWINVGKNNGLQKIHKWSFAKSGNKAFFANRNGAFRFEGGQAVPIKEGNKDALNSALNESFGNLYYVTFPDVQTSERVEIEQECLGYAFYDEEHDEYGFKVGMPAVDMKNYLAEFGDNITERRALVITETSSIILDIIDIGPFTGVDDLTIYIIDGSTKDKTIFIRRRVENNIRVQFIEPDGSLIVGGAIDLNSFADPTDETLKITKLVDGFDVQVIDQISLDLSNKLFVYCDNKDVKSFISEWDYPYDKVLAFDNKKYGFREGTIYELEKGNLVNGEVIEFSVYDVVNPTDARREDVNDYTDQEKEFIRIQVNSNIVNKSDLTINFFKTLVDESNSVFSTLNGADMKKYGGLTNYIPRGLSQRYQNNYIIFKVKYNGQEDFTITSTSIQYKILK